VIGVGTARPRPGGFYKLLSAYDFLIDTYETERIKVLSTWSEFRDEDLPVRPLRTDPRGRSVHEQMVHQCVSEDGWFRTMRGIDVGAPPLPQRRTQEGGCRGTRRRFMHMPAWKRCSRERNAAGTSRRCQERAVSRSRRPDIGVGRGIARDLPGQGTSASTR